MGELDIINHMKVMHYEYSDEGRVISIEDYARMVHEQDHENGDGIRYRHQHERELDQEVLL